MFVIRPADPRDAPAIWSMLEPEIRAGETFAQPRDLTREQALTYWLNPDHEVWVAEQAADILGSYYLRVNQRGGGAHVANAGYLTAAHARGRGIARRMLEASLDRARARGFRAMQFNFVVSSNQRAIATWQAYGFEIVARLPRSFEHPVLGFIDALVMYLNLYGKNNP